MTQASDVLERLPMKDFPEEDILVHLKRANRDFRDKTFEADDENFDEVEAVACKAIYYLAPLLWQKIQDRANEFDHTLHTFGDLEVFQNYWLDRSNSIPVTNSDDGKVNTGGIQCRAV